MITPHLQLLIFATAALTGVALACGVYVILSWIMRLSFDRREFKINVPLLFRVMVPLSQNMVPITRGPSFSEVCLRTDVKLVQAGLDQFFRPEEFVALRLVYGIVFMIFALFFFIGGQILGADHSFPHFLARLLSLFGIFLLGVGMIYPPLWLHGVVKRRHRSIQRALPNVLDLLTLSVEAGRDFLTALRDILRNRPPDPLTDELERVFRETQLGKPRRQALRDMALRVRQPDLSSVVEALAQADELGVSIGHILRILGDQMRQKRFQMAEKLANEAPVKMMLPLFVFIFPAVMIVIFGPILLKWKLTSFLQ